MKVCIFDEGLIPGLGNGPFRTPVEITEEQYALYKRMGLKIINATKNVAIAETGVINRMVEVKETPTKIKTDKNLDNLEKLVNNLKPNKASEPIVQEVVKEEVLEQPKEVKETIEETEEILNEEIPSETTEEVLEEVSEETDEIVEKEVEIDLDACTKKELMALLTENEIEFNPKATKKELIELANEKL